MGRESEGAKRLCFQTVDDLANGIPGTFDGALGGFAQQLEPNPAAAVDATEGLRLYLTYQ